MFDRWVAALEARHLTDLTFREVVRALRALSSRYVERRAAINSALDTKGKRAAFALFYGPLHFLLVQQVVRALDATRVGSIVDLGCGTGVGGAAWALAGTIHAPAAGIDRHPWAVAESAWTYRTLHVRGHAKRGDFVSFLDTRRARRACEPGSPRRVLCAVGWEGAERGGVSSRPGGAPASDRAGVRGGAPGKTGSALLAAFAINELSAAERNLALGRLARLAGGGHPLLIVEPIARGAAPWWDEWAAAFERLGGRADEWRFPTELPELVAKLDDAAGMDHRELTGRSIWMPGPAEAGHYD